MSTSLMQHPPVIPGGGDPVATLAARWEESNAQDCWEEGSDFLVELTGQQLRAAFEQHEPTISRSTGGTVRTLIDLIDVIEMTGETCFFGTEGTPVAYVPVPADVYRWLEAFDLPDQIPVCDESGFTTVNGRELLRLWWD